MRWWWDRHPAILQTLLLKQASPRCPSLRHLKHSLWFVATFHLSLTVISLKCSQDHRPWGYSHTLHFLTCFFLGLQLSSLVKKVLSFFTPSLVTPVMVSEAVIINSASQSMNSLNVFTLSVLWSSHTHCLYFPRRVLLNLRWEWCRVTYSQDLLPNSHRWGSQL